MQTHRSISEKTRARRRAGLAPGRALLFTLVASACGDGGESPDRSEPREAPPAVTPAAAAPVEGPLASHWEASRTAPWKAPLEKRAGVAASLDDFADQLGVWLSEEWMGTGDRRHRLRIVNSLELAGHLHRSRSFRLYGDGSEEFYLEEDTFPNAARPGVLPAFLFFDDGLFADAVWVDDGEGVKRLDCDLYWPDGRTGRIRDLFVRVAPDTIRWTSHRVREEGVDRESVGTFTLVRDPGSPGEGLR